MANLDYSMSSKFYGTVFQPTSNKMVRLLIGSVSVHFNILPIERVNKYKLELLLNFLG